MKEHRFVSIWIRTFHSLRSRGPKRTAQSILIGLEEYWYAIKHGGGILAEVKLAGLDIESENQPRGVDYAPTRSRCFRKLMENLDFSDNSVFVDLGSGKGRVLCMASKFPFKRVVGVEFSHYLCEEARRYVSMFREKMKIGADTDIEIVESDVVDYEINDDENVFYLFHPFDATVLGRVLSNLSISLEKKPREMWLIYQNPRDHRIIEAQSNFVLSKRFVYGASEYNVYRGVGEQKAVRP